MRVPYGARPASGKKMTELIGYARVGKWGGKPASSCVVAFSLADDAR